MTKKALLWLSAVLVIFAVFAIHDEPTMSALAAIGAYTLYLVSEVTQ